MPNCFGEEISCSNRCAFQISIQIQGACLHFICKLWNMAIDLKHNNNNREQFKKKKKKRKRRCWSTSVPAVDVYAATPPTFCRCRKEKQVDWWFSREQRRECVFVSRSLLDMWEDGTDRVLRSWCLQQRRGRRRGRRNPPPARHSEGYVHKGWTLLVWTVPEHIHLIWKTADYTENK